MNPLYLSRQEFYKVCKARTKHNGFRIGLWWEEESLKDVNAAIIYYVKYARAHPSPQLGDCIRLAKQGIALRVDRVVTGSQTSQSASGSLMDRSCQGILECSVQNAATNSRGRRAEVAVG